MKNSQQTVDQTMELARKAYSFFKVCPGTDKAAFLRLIGRKIEAIGDELIFTATEETLLPEGRIRGERGRTIGQLNQFAELLEEGSWVDASIDTADTTTSGADLRRMLVPMGPVVVFGAGNFPLAFSVAGGDTASALAGGNPVVVKAHPAHPRTGQLVAQAIRQSLEQLNWPEGIFGFIEDSSYQSGQLLVQHPETKSVGFTGSLSGGTALLKLAAGRDEPIPVFAEMGSVNPVVLFPEALQSRPAQIAADLVASINMGAGQFCTNPGLVITSKGEGFSEFLQKLATGISRAASNGMFSDSVYKNYRLHSEKVIIHEQISLLAKGADSISREAVTPSVATVSAVDFIHAPELREEVFGPFSLVVICDSTAQQLEVIESLGGQLTTTLQASETDLKNEKQLVDTMIEKCGRILFNGVPTGVEVCTSMQHGGPFPAASDSRFTSVGTAAIKRFVRPVSFQDFPQFALPAELKNANPLNIWRKLNTKWSKDKL